MDENRYYMCGYCGQQVDHVGNPLIQTEPLISEDTILIVGNCCLHYEQHHTITVTRDMAIDAGDRGLEGQEWVW